MQMVKNTLKKFNPDMEDYFIMGFGSIMLGAIWPLTILFSIAVMIVKKEEQEWVKWLKWLKKPILRFIKISAKKKDD